jgi:anti-sigma regulatory factor (Ser/Thr protein kinase)
MKTTHKTINLTKISRHFKAEAGELILIYDFISKTLDKSGVSQQYILLLQMAADEIFTNITEYGYKDSGRENGVTVELGVEGGVINLVFVDCGVPFDPMTAQIPDISLSAEERPFGGLGIHMVRSSMDDVSYTRDGERNVLMLSKKIIA